MRLIWKIRELIQWLREYISLTPGRYDAVVSKLESLLWFATGGMYSKAGYSLSVMEGMVNDYIEDCCQEAVREALEEKREGGGAVLESTVKLMLSDDYKDRFKAEYQQTKIRYEKLKNFNAKIEAARKDPDQPMPPHDCPDAMLREQAEVMEKYLTILELRAEIEGVSL